MTEKPVHQCLFSSSVGSGEYLCPKELSPGPQKWSPNVSKGTSVFQFLNPKQRGGTDVSKTPELVQIQIPSSVQRKRKDNQANPDPDRSDVKKISRSNRYKNPEAFDSQCQCDQIRRKFAIWVAFSIDSRIFFCPKSNLKFGIFGPIFCIFCFGNFLGVFLEEFGLLFS